MITSVLLAFAVALFLQLLSLMSKRFRSIISLVISFSIICIYFFTDKSQIDFPLEMDFSTWLLLVMLSDNLLNLLIDKPNEKLKESENMKK